MKRSGEFKLENNARLIAAQIAQRLQHVPRTVPKIRALRRQISRQLICADRRTMLGIGRDLIRNAPSGRFVAYELIKHHEPTLASVSPADVENLGRGMGTWDQVDCFSCYIAGPDWRMGLITDDIIQGWAKSRDWCWRRAALVSTVPLNAAAHGGTGDTKRTIRICDMLVGDREDMVVKALSWALRVLSARDPQAVRRFLSDHNGKVAARVVREVNNKLMTGLKNPKQKTRAPQLQPQ